MNFREELNQSLIKLGWHLNPESIEEFLSESSKPATNELVKKALNCDLRTIGAKSLSEDQFQGKCEKFDGNIVLQLVKLRNIAAPKENETSNTAPRMFKITLTDGTTNCNALVLNEIPKLNLNTPPGTKIYLKAPIRVKCNLLMLDGRNTEVLGGEVDYMVSKWKANKDLSNYVRISCQTDNPPPPWVPFGIKQKNTVDTSKKVFAENQKSEEVDSNSEFSQARQAALAEALEAKSKVTKTFTQLPIEKSQAAEPMQAPRSMASTFIQAPRPVETNPPERKKKTRKGKRGDRSDEEDYADVKGAAKPKEVTLFDVFKKKLDITDQELEQASGGAQPPPPVEREPPRYNRGRGGRNQRSQNHASMAQAPKLPQKEYNPNDFNFDLTGENSKSASGSNQSRPSQPVSTPAAQNPQRQSSGGQNYRQGNRNYDNRNRQQPQYQPMRNQNEFQQPQQFYQQPNYNQNPNMFYPPPDQYGQYDQFDYQGRQGPPPRNTFYNSGRGGNRNNNNRGSYY